jgi:hypothetical protein
MKKNRVNNIPNEISSSDIRLFPSCKESRNSRSWLRLELGISGRDGCVVAGDVYRLHSESFFRISTNSDVHSCKMWSSYFGWAAVSL